MAIHLDSIRPVFSDERRMLVTDLPPEECRRRLTTLVEEPERIDPGLRVEVERDRFTVARGAWAVVRARGELAWEVGHTRAQVDLAWSWLNEGMFIGLALIATLLPFASYFLPARERWPNDWQSVIVQLVVGWLMVLVLFGLSHWVGQRQKRALMRDLQSALEAEDVTQEA
jgi:hypothetical protein